MHFLSNASQYAISAVIYLARLPKGKSISAGDLAKPIECPPAYLSQTLAKLIPSGIIKSRRGLNGGVSLNRKPENISLYEIVIVIDGDTFFNTCFLGVKGCGSAVGCPFHWKWGELRGNIQEWLEETTVQDALGTLTIEWMERNLKFDRFSDS